MEPNSKIDVAILKSFPIFESVGEDTLHELARCTSKVKIQKHEAIYEEGSRSDSIYFLMKGVAKIGAHSEDGREIIKQVLHPMAMFGELCIAGEEKRKNFALAMNRDVELLCLPALDVQRAMRNDHQLAIHILKFIGRRLQRAESRLESLIFKDARERIIEFLKESAQKQGKRIGYEMLIRHCLTQQDIANLTGTSRQTVTSVLNDLKKSNLIYFNRRSILIRDLGKLS